jgi:hypothetical protein
MSFESLFSLSERTCHLRRYNGYIFEKVNN